MRDIGGGTNGAKGLKPPKNSTYIMNNNKVIAFLTRIKLNIKQSVHVEPAWNDNEGGLCLTMV